VRYFLYGYYGCGNFGDDLLLEALLLRIRKSDSAAQFVIRSRGVTPRLLSPDAYFTEIETIMESSGNRLFKVLKYLRVSQQLIKDVDVVVVGGGTLFLDKGRFNRSLFLLWLMLRNARKQGKRIIITGVAVDTLAHPLSRWLTKKIFALADFVAVRDALSLPYVAHCNAATTVQSADLVLTLPHPNQTALRPILNRPRIGLCFIDYYGVNDPDSVKRQQYLAQIISWIRKEKSNADFCWLTFQIDIGLRDNWLLDAMKEVGLDYPVYEVQSLQQLQDILPLLSGVVSTRFHLGLLCAQNVTPVVVIEHELKMQALAHDFGLPSLTLDDFMRGNTGSIVSLLAKYDDSFTAAAVITQQRLAENNFLWLTT
jgi:polysaccharide pyruvyl transferase WcaK-like protein